MEENVNTGLDIDTVVKIVEATTKFRYPVCSKCKLSDHWLSSSINVIYPPLRDLKSD